MGIVRGEEGGVEMNCSKKKLIKRRRRHHWPEDLGGEEGTVGEVAFWR